MKARMVGVAAFRQLAVYWGKECVRAIRSAEIPDGERAITAEQRAITCAVKAAHLVHQADALQGRLEAPYKIRLANQQIAAERAATRARCEFRRVQAHTNKEGLISHEIGDPCGGKLKTLKLRGEAITLECATCGRQYPLPATLTPEITPEPIEPKEDAA